MMKMMMMMMTTMMMMKLTLYFQAVAADAAHVLITVLNVTTNAHKLGMTQR